MRRGLETLQISAKRWKDIGLPGFAPVHISCQDHDGHGLVYVQQWNGHAWVKVSDRDSFLAARRVTREEGILIGGSGGLAAHAALDVARQVEGDVQQALANLRASQDKLATSELQVEQADTALSLAETRYRAGVITNLEVLDAQTALAEARLLRLRTQYAFVQSRYALERAVGARPR